MQKKVKNIHNLVYTHFLDNPKSRRRIQAFSIFAFNEKNRCNRRYTITEF